MPGLPGGFNPFFINPGWIDAAYMTYAFPDYLRRTANIPQSGSMHTPLVKGKIKLKFLCFLYLYFVA